MKSDLPDALTQEEATRLLTTAAKSCPNAVAPYAAVLAFSTGMRSGEIKGIRSATCTTNRPIRLCMSGGPRVRPTPEQGVWHWTEWRSGVFVSWLREPSELADGELVYTNLRTIPVQGAPHFDFGPTTSLGPI